MYSEDPGSARHGGEMGLRAREEFLKPFADAAFVLRAGQVSQIVETEYGFHIIQMIEKKGEMANLRHILLKPKFSAETQRQSTDLLDSIATLILKDSITFERAALRYSEDKDTRLNGGYTINPATQTNRFDKDQLQPADYFVLRDMKQGNVSRSFPSKDLRGNDNFKIIKITRVIPSHRATWDDDYGIICEIARNKQQQQVLEQWITKAINRTYVRISAPEMEGCNFKHEWWK
jgi:peptidyl-prolyl cis-trans isomerase SurA